MDLQWCTQVSPSTCPPPVEPAAREVWGLDLDKAAHLQVQVLGALLLHWAAVWVLGLWGHDRTKLSGDAGIAVYATMLDPLHYQQLCPGFLEESGNEMARIVRTVHTDPRRFPNLA